MLDLFSSLLSLSFKWPWLLCLLPLPWLVRFRSTSSQSTLIAPELPLFETVKQLGVGSGASAIAPSKIKRALYLAAWLLLVVAAMRPTYIGEQVDIPLSGRDLMLAIDISPSMKEKDMELDDRPATRLDIVKSVVSDFIEQRKGDRIGLILFGSQPYIQSPLSFDTVTVNTLLQEAFLGMAGQATAIGDAIALGVKRLRTRPEQSRVLILLSDGANTAGEIPPEKAAQLAAQDKIKIYSIGIGAEEMVKRSFFGAQVVNPSAELDEAMLTNIASQTNGRYFRARNTTELTTIYDEINKLEPVERETRSYRPSKALFHWFLGSALLIAVLAAIYEPLRARLLGIVRKRKEGTHDGL